RPRRRGAARRRRATGLRGVAGPAVDRAGRPGGGGRRRPGRELDGPRNTVGTGGARAGRPPGSPGGASAPGEPRPSLSATARAHYAPGVKARGRKRNGVVTAAGRGGSGGRCELAPCERLVAPLPDPDHRHRHADALLDDVEVVPGRLWQLPERG